MRKKLLLIPLALLLAISLIAIGCPTTPPETTTPPTTAPPTTAPPEEEAPVILRLTIVQPPQDHIAIGTQKMADRFNERAEGYRIEVYPAEQLVKYMETMDAVRTGAVEMANIGMGGFASVMNMPLLGVGEIPLLYDSIEANAEVVAQLPELLDEQFQAHLNAKPLGIFTPGPMELISTKPVRTLDDWKGIKLAAATYYGPEVAQRLGAGTVSIPFPDFYSSLQKGVIDGIWDSPSFTVIAKLYEVTQYQTISCILPGAHGFTINLDVWNKMPEEIQDILVEEAKRAANELNETTIGSYYSAFEVLAEEGMEQYYLPKEERDKWEEVLSPYIDDELSKMGEIGQEVKQLADEANKKYPYPY